MVHELYINTAVAKNTVGENIQGLGLGKEFLDLTSKVQSITRINWTSSKLKGIC